MSKRKEHAPTAKSRIREYITEHDLAVKTVETRCGYSNGFLSAGGEIGSDRLARFIKNYPDADLDYIVTGVASKKETGDGPKIRVLLELELSVDEFVKFGLKDKAIRLINIG